MANVRVCLYLLVLLVSYKLASAEPEPQSGLCSFLCGDDDDDDDDYYDVFDIFGICSLCSSEPSTSTTSSNPEAQNPVQIVLPPANGLNLSVSSSPNGAVVMNLMPWPAPPAPPAQAAAPQATTAAPAAATTAAGDATTAEATTKAAK